jgi:formate dehydrogenase major subunit/formate dehydrogenase alpha subunit
VISDLAHRLLARQGRYPLGPYAAWDYADSAAVMDEVSRLTPIYAGVSHARIDRGEHQQWPVIDAEHPGTPILHVHEFPRGKGKFHAVDHLPPAELPDEEYPFLMTTGRVLYHWHAGEMTRRGRGLASISPESLLEISPDDAVRMGICDEQAVLVQSRRGEMTARAVVTPRVAPGLLFANFHFPAEHNVNNVTVAALDPIAKIPEYKVCAVRLSSPAGRGGPADGRRV